jgi:hypothetical protein
LELRWYWRVVRRQLRIIWLSLLVVAVLAGAYTAYTYVISRYKAQSTIEFSQLPPSYHTQNIPEDPEQAAQGNAGTARDNAKQFTQGISYFQEIQSYLKVHFNQTLDWKVIRAGLGANPTGARYLEVEYTASSESTSLRLVNAATAILRNTFLPHYNATVLVNNGHGNVDEPPINMYIFDPPNAPAMPLSTTVIGWFAKSLLGIVLGVALAFFWEYLDESVHDEQDVRSWMHTPTLGVIPGGKERAA